VKSLTKAASKGAIPKSRAARKVSRLTLLAKKLLPEAVKGHAAK
jgi:ribosomal protein S20